MHRCRVLKSNISKTNNTIVRVDSDSKYLLLPVQESIDDATVKIIVDGKLERTLAVRMAKSKVDYTVPLDLTPYKGHDLILDVVTSQSRSSVREAKDDACWNNIAFADTIDTTNREKYRPIYHHTPIYGWMNDPNGMVYKDGVLRPVLPVESLRLEMAESIMGTIDKP